MYLRICGSFQSIRKVSHLRNVRKSNKLSKSANLRICNCRTYLWTALLWIGLYRPLPILASRE
jgi:hypothetical protein